MRFVVTGSRFGIPAHVVRTRLTLLAQPGDTLVVGDAAGVDAVAAAFWSEHGPVEVYRPTWKHPDGTYNPGAGHARNVKMVDSGVDLVAGFLAQCTKTTCARPQPHGSHGTAHCLEYAKSKGIAVVTWYGAEGLR